MLIGILVQNQIRQPHQIQSPYIFHLCICRVQLNVQNGVKPNKYLLAELQLVYGLSTRRYKRLIPTCEEIEKL